MSIVTFLSGIALISLMLSINMTFAWLVWRSTRNSGWIDTIWTFGLGAIGAFSALLLFSNGAMLRSWLVAAMALAWCLRLGVHIAWRTAGITDDPRYAKLIEAWGSDAARQMFWLLQKQALVSIPLAVTMWLAARNPQPGLSVGDLIAMIIFAAALAGEAIADEQLRRFRLDPQNRNGVCDAGLWRWSRHPNYFFEWLGWLAYPVLALNFNASYLWGLFAFAAPVCMYWLLVHVSGVPPLEQHMLSKRGEEFRRYQSRTNAFFPWPPKTITGDIQ